MNCNKFNKKLNKTCCCICKNHYPLYCHPLVDKKPISLQDGYICLPPEFGHVAIKCNKHGLCELFENNS